MDSDSWVKLAIYICFLFGAAYCAAAESAFSGMNKIRVKNLAEDGDRKAKKAMGISEDFDKAITALLIGTNVMHIGCASLSTVIGLDLWGEIYGQGTATTIATVVTTIVVYFASELVPKCLAKANSEKVACAFAPSLRVMMTVLTPFVWLFSGISSLLVRLFPKNEEPTYTEEELVTIIETGEEEGVLDEESSVSGGQKQLLTIARAMIQNSPMMILDEATSNVDTRTEELIQEAMDRLTRGRTSFVIAHRLSTIKNADLILVMKDGNIIEQGNHEQLISEGGFYAALYNSQFELV